ncbi:unnamed protein product [Albugo candida]|uniref:Uncharacterized protein n=1 Tax=Albugo candida TaxID=65357 RepID=A0A024G580_9STRA|nr:unnamed protein product [Albugo candida]|eukprot:CCI41886.1 unnamed protein product [Albugo candida]
MNARLVSVQLNLTGEVEKQTSPPLGPSSKVSITFSKQINSATLIAQLYVNALLRSYGYVMFSLAGSILMMIVSRPFCWRNCCIPAHYDNVIRYHAYTLLKLHD